MTNALTDRELVGVYLLLRRHASELDTTLTRLMMRMEKDLFAYLSIDEFERLGELYETNTGFTERTE